MARFKLARAGFILLIVICGFGGYFLHSLVRSYAYDSPPLSPLVVIKSDPRRVRTTSWPWRSSGQKDKIHAKQEREEGEKLVFGDDGLVRNWEHMEGRDKKYATMSSQVRHTHPIYHLIRKGQDRWERMLKRQSKTLPQAVTEYKRRYGRPPPRGFDQWWKFARRNDIKIVDDYDQIHRDIEPFFALSPKVLRKRRDQLKSEPHSYEIFLDPRGPSSIKGKRAAGVRPGLLFQLLEPIAQHLPQRIVFHGSDHDLGSTLLGDDQRQALLDAARDKRYLTEETLRGFEDGIQKRPIWGTAAACPVGSLAWNQTIAKKSGGRIPTRKTETTFIHHPPATYDFCTNPTHLQHHGSYSFDFPRTSKLRPIFQWSKQYHNSDFLATPLEAYANASSTQAIHQYTPWEEKSDDRVFWRGSPTGDFYTKDKNTEWGWRASHRPRLALMAQAKEGTSRIWVQRGKEWRLEEWKNERLNEVYLDVGLTGKSHQCNEEDGTCDEITKEIKWLDRVSPEEAARFKYALDVDGNGWSSRFHRLMMSGSVVLKSTIYPEWISDWLIPWVHYVPVQVDYSDLYNIMSFFAGPPHHLGGGNDDLAQVIAENARKFGEEHWRWEDMQGYMFRLLLEYSRLEADDRDAASYHRLRT